MVLRLVQGVVLIMLGIRRIAMIAQKLRAIDINELHQL